MRRYHCLRLPDCPALAGPRLRRPARRARWLGAGGAVLLLAATLLPAARADSIRMEGFWVDGVNVVDIKDGQLHYLAPDGTDVYKPIAVIQGLKLTALPSLGQAQILLDNRRDPAKAVALLEQARRQAGGRGWLVQWIDSRLVQAADAAKDAPTAVNAYLGLVNSGAGAAYLKYLPTHCFSGLSAAVKNQLEQRLDNALSSVPAGAGREALQQLRAAMAAPAQSTPAVPAAGGTPTVPGPTPPAVSPSAPAPTQAPAEPAVALPAGSGASVVPLAPFLPQKDPITALLKQGQFQEAVQAVDKLLQTPVSDAYLRLYQKGVALENLALKDKDHPDQDLLKAAGLCFMRVVIFFPHNSYAAPSLIETANIHLLIGRKDLAVKLCKEASGKVEESDPVLWPRLQAIYKEATAKAPAATP